MRKPLFSEQRTDRYIMKDEKICLFCLGRWWRRVLKRWRKPGKSKQGYEGFWCNGSKGAAFYSSGNSVFSGPVTHLLSMLWVLVKILLHASAKKKTKNVKVQISQFYWLFSSNVMAVKGLKSTFLESHLKKKILDLFCFPRSLHQFFHHTLIYIYLL